MVRSPVRTLEAVAEGQRTGAALGVMASLTGAYLLFGLLASALFWFASPFPDGRGAGLLILFPMLFLLLGGAVSFVYWLLVSRLMHFVTGLFGGRGDFDRTLAVVGAACVPIVIGTLLTIPALAVEAALALASLSGRTEWQIGNNALTSAISLGSFLWHAVLAVIGARFARAIDYGRSTASCGLGCGGLVVLPLRCPLGARHRLRPGLNRKPGPRDRRGAARVGSRNTPRSSRSRPARGPARPPGPDTGG